MGTIRVRVLGDCATVIDSNHEEAGEMYREIRKMFRDGASRMIPFDTTELAASFRELSDQLGDLSGRLRAVAGYELQAMSCRKYRWVWRSPSTGAST